MANRPIASAVANIDHVAAFCDAVADTLAELNIGTVLVQLPDYAPPKALPFLAQQVDALGYKGFGLCATDDQRRSVIKTAPANNRRMGTPGSIKRAIKALGFPDVIVTKNTGIRHNGIYRHDGIKRHGGIKWYNIDVEVFYTGAAPDGNMVVMLTKMIDEYKAERSVLFNLKFTEVV